MIITYKLVIICTASFLVLGASRVIAQDIHLLAHEDANKFGRLSSSDVCDGGNGCGPAAAVNALYFLENQYPNIYGHKLIPILGTEQEYADFQAVANILSGDNFMKTCSCEGTYIDYFVYGLDKYVEQKIPDRTKFQVNTRSNWTVTSDGKPVDEPDYVENRDPSPSFITNQIHSYEALEIGLVFKHVTGGHDLTVTGIDYNKTLNGGTGNLYYIDPVDGLPHDMTISQSSKFGPISAMWTNPVTHIPKDSLIDFAEGVSPVPESTSWALILTGFTGIGAAVRARRETIRAAA